MLHWLKAAIVATAMIANVAQADAVADWAELQTAVAKAEQNPNPPFDADRYHSYSRVMLAMFEAANSVDRRFVSYLGLPAAAPGASDVAAVHAAARTALAAIYPDQKAQIDKAYAMAIAGVAAGPARDAGVAAGEAAARAAVKAGGRDLARQVGVYRPHGAAGQWVPSTIPFAPEDVTMRPWFMTSADAMRIAPPPSLTGKAWADAFNEVKARGAKASTVRTAAETELVKFWMDYDIDPVMRQVGGQPGRSLVRNARFYAAMAMAMDDQGIAMAEGKMHHMFWRPMNAIRNGEIDGNDATAPDPAWEPLIRTPGQPEYPCGHCSLAGVVSVIVAAEGPPPADGYHFTSGALPGFGVSMPTVAAYEQSVMDSRINGGVHFRTTNDASLPIGHEIGKLALARLAPLPM